MGGIGGYNPVDVPGVLALARLAWTLFGVTVLFGVLDVIDVVLQHLKRDAAPLKDDETAEGGDDDEEEEVPSAKFDKLGNGPDSYSANIAFNLEPHRRKRFAVSMANRTRWPLVPRLTGIKKKLQ